MMIQSSKTCFPYTNVGNTSIQVWLFVRRLSNIHTTTTILQLVATSIFKNLEQCPVFFYISIKVVYIIIVNPVGKVGAGNYR